VKIQQRSHGEASTA